MPESPKPETYSTLVNGVKVTLQKCLCGTWFWKNRKDKDSCSNNCSAKASQKKKKKPVQSKKKNK